MHDTDDPLYEVSDDVRRGERPHIAAALALGRQLGLCTRCQRREAVALIDSRGTPRGVCGACAQAWRELSPLERRAARTAWVAGRR